MMEKETDIEELIRLREENMHLRANIESNAEVQPATTPAPAFNPTAEVGALTGKGSQYKVNIKLPPFMTHKPAVWFAQVEFQFRTAGINDDSEKFYYVAGHLDPKLSIEVEDLILNPPAKNKYKKLKEELIKRLSLSQEQRLRHILGEVEMGSRKPSQFLRQLQSVAGSEIGNEKLLRQLWLRRLPVQAQTVLAAVDHLSLSEVADMADKIVELTQPTASLHAASDHSLPPTYSRPLSPVPSSAPSTSSFSRIAHHSPQPIANPLPDHTLTELIRAITDLSRQVAILSDLPRQVATLSAQVQQFQKNRTRDRSFSRDRERSARSNSPSAQASPDGLCYYHSRFRERAYKCRAPCTWTSENAPRSQ